MEFQFNDGGRKESGRKGFVGDCVARSIAIASGRPYEEIYQALADGQANTRKTARMPKAGKRSARNGVYVKTKWFKEFMASLGFVWVPTMHIGQGCKVHLADGELPDGRLVVAVSKHYTAVIDQVVQDTSNPQRTTYWYGPNGEITHKSGRCVYGYWKLAEA